MPNFTQIIEEMKEAQEQGSENALDSVRRKYIKALSNHTDRNTICYYSSFLKNDQQPNIDITDRDKNYFMATVCGMDSSKGLDLILHTPGGSVTAAESIVHYLNAIFDGDIRAIVPQISMSAGTILACGCKSIVMGKQSNIGPFDPLIQGMSCHNVIDEFQKASDRIKVAPHEQVLWNKIIEKIPPTFLLRCEQAIDMASAIVTKWLTGNMLKDEEDKEVKAEKIVSLLNNPSHTKDHGRHIHMDDAAEMGLKIEKLEDDQQFQDLVLSVHHSFMVTLDNTNISKIVENQIDVCMAIQAK
ncbi:SDH family Clp fold serine proteinase [Vreelandella titanicae]|uniref:Serine protease n=1 Tax=Vreelandella titanicae TaxID=664683 RepID=A0AAP9NQ91_9GAMM|nr:ATP-dependent Clp protease proteolytic subunit [Halomonas titanicae]QKS26564.1 hypothetical protein FX987_04373 [Halomonas titanicae]